MFHFYSNSKKGFTLIEIMVAVALFSVVMMVGVGSLLTVVEANRKAQALQSVTTNLNFALENMSRTIRTGTHYHCGSGGNIEEPQDCANGDSYFVFEGFEGDTSSSADQIVYRLNGTQVERSLSGGAVDTFVPLTAPEIVVEKFAVYVFGAEDTDLLQPEVVLILQGEASTSPRSTTEFDIQTSVTQRILDI